MFHCLNMFSCAYLSCQVAVISLIWAVLCAVASGLFSEVVFKLQEDNWDDSTDERIEWRYQHAQAAVVRAFLCNAGKFGDS